MRENRPAQPLPQLTLRRELGFAEVTLSGVGIILGAGIYALLGEATVLAGSAIRLTFAISALIAAFTALGYAELSSIFPRASAEYEYVTNAFGRRLAFVIGWLIILSGIFGIATVSLGFAGYFLDLVGFRVLPSAILVILVLTAILLVGVKETARVAIALTLIEAGASLCSPAERISDTRVRGGAFLHRNRRGTGLSGRRTIVKYGYTIF